jgi:polyhydroxyalkanoate synthesis regulator phasin
MNKMKLLKKGILVAIGLGAITKEKVEHAVDKMSKEGYLNVSEGKKLASSLLKDARSREKRLMKLLEKKMRKAYSVSKKKAKSSKYRIKAKKVAKKFAKRFKSRAKVLAKRVKTRVTKRMGR